jgi:very-short-patch-repair endonuclease
MADGEKITPPPGFEGLSNDTALKLYRAFVKRWFELMLERCDKDLARLGELDLYDQLALRARWEKEVDLLLAAFSSMRKYDSEKGKFELIAQVFGDQFGLPAQSLPGDIEQRIDWYKKRVATEYERSLKREVNVHSITSPIEQIFLMEWRFLRVDERYGLKIRPQDTLKVDGTTYNIDFVVETPNGEMKLAIELDGHDFHEKTKEQAARDRQRERTIVKQGYTIFRFTGSEVFRNPRQCVEEVIEMIASSPE